MANFISAFTGRVAAFLDPKGSPVRGPDHLDQVLRGLHIDFSSRQSRLAEPPSPDAAAFSDLDADLRLREDPDEGYRKFKELIKPRKS